MRRTLIAFVLVAGLLLLAGCGNKGPLVRPPANPANTAPKPVAPASAPTPARPSSSPTSTGPAYRSPPVPASSTGFVP